MRTTKLHYVILLLIFVLTGCYKDSSDNLEVKEIVNNNAILNTLKNQTAILINLDSIKDIYNGKKIEYKDIIELDKIKYGLLYVSSLGNLKSLNKDMINTAKKYNIDKNSEFISISEISKYIKEAFGPVNIKYKDINGCPSYIFNSSDKLYYINRKCNMNEDYIIYYYDDITNLDNNYYVTIYLGFVSNNKIYKDINKKKLLSNNIIEINSSNKNMFDSYNYIYTKNSDGNYIFTSAEKNN